jgi:hypothetical protein
MNNAKLLNEIAWAAAVALAGMAVGCGSSDQAAPGDGGVTISTIAMDPPVILDSTSTQCTEPHTVCMTAQMPSPLVMGPPTHLAVAFYKQVPVMTPAEARGVLQAPPLQAGQVFRLKSPDGNLTGSYYPVILLYMQGGGDIIAVDGLDYTACDSSISGDCEAAVLYPFNGQPVNVTDTLQLVYGL